MILGGRGTFSQDQDQKFDPCDLIKKNKPGI